ncbi:hypothetical protein [Nitratireductor thuwali]|uniref:DUF4169 domain-containing protein n=1 Tax=Nitratireductor thuwali TaxID=2267699 RepID=A0ABY5MM83_9HYPH|nr:hypothetical protein NTH_03577 [Nitratireductor thuwali]
MSAKDQEKPERASSKDGGRAERLAAELRANLARRKAQARSRRAGEADGREEGIPSAKPGNDDSRS